MFVADSPFSYKTFRRKQDKRVYPSQLEFGLKGGFQLPTGLNPARSKAWGLDSFVFFPNFMVLIWKPNWVLTYHYWPTSYNTHIFEGTCYFAPPKNALERLAQELAVVTFKEYALQDGNTLWLTQVYEDPETFEGVAARYMAWTRRPGEFVFPYECDPSYGE